MTWVIVGIVCFIVVSIFAGCVSASMESYLDDDNIPPSKRRAISKDPYGVEPPKNLSFKGNDPYGVEPPESLSFKGNDPYGVTPRF